MQNGWTALTFCCMKVSVDGVKIVQLLLSHEANPNIQDEVYTVYTHGLVVAKTLINSLCCLGWLDAAHDCKLK